MSQKMLIVMETISWNIFYLEWYLIKEWGFLNKKTANRRPAPVTQYVSKRKWFMISLLKESTFKAYPEDIQQLKDSVFYKN